MKIVDLLNSSVNYIDITDPNAPKLLMPKPESEIPSDESTAAFQAITNLTKLSTRNNKGAYNVPIVKPEVLLNFLPRKRFVEDSSISYVIDILFDYFQEITNEDSERLPFDLLEGTIFRVVGEGVKSSSDYTYYMIEDDVVVQLPNFKTVQVNLAERGSTVSDIKVIEKNDFNEMKTAKQKQKLIDTLIENGKSEEQANEEANKQFPPSNSGSSGSSGGSNNSNSNSNSSGGGGSANSPAGGGGSSSGGGSSNSSGEAPVAEDKQDEWTPELESATFLETYASLSATASAAGAAVAAITTQTNLNVAAVQAEAEQAQAEAVAAGEASVASQAASAAAIASAQAAQQIAIQAAAEAQTLQGDQVIQLQALEEEVDGLGNRVSEIESTL